MWPVMLGLLMIAQAEPTSRVRSEPVTVTNSRPPAFAGRIGICEADGRSYNLNRLLRLENDAAEIDGPQGPLRVSISEEYVEISTAGTSPGRTVYSTNIGDAVDPTGNLDVELKLGYIEGMLVIFWKETFRYRIYRQGLFRVSGEGVAPLCAGRGGVTIRD